MKRGIVSNTLIHSVYNDHLISQVSGFSGKSVPSFWPRSPHFRLKVYCFGPKRTQNGQEVVSIELDKPIN